VLNFFGGGIFICTFLTAGSGRSRHERIRIKGGEGGLRMRILYKGPTLSGNSCTRAFAAAVLGGSRRSASSRKKTGYGKKKGQHQSQPLFFAASGGFRARSLALRLRSRAATIKRACAARS